MLASTNMCRPGSLSMLVEGKNCLVNLTSVSLFKDLASWFQVSHMGSGKGVSQSYLSFHSS